METNWIRSSVSARVAFAICPKLWFLRYRCPEIPTGPQNYNARNIGSTVHLVMEALVRAQMGQEAPPALTEVPVDVPVDDTPVETLIKEHWTLAERHYRSKHRKKKAYEKLLLPSGLTLAAYHAFWMQLSKKVIETDFSEFPLPPLPVRAEGGGAFQRQDLTPEIMALAKANAEVGKTKDPDSFGQLVAACVSRVQEIENKNLPEGQPAWEPTPADEALMYALARALRNALGNLDGLEFVEAEYKLRVGNYFTGIVDLIARLRNGNWMIVDYKLLSSRENLDGNIRDTQLRMYEAVAPHIAKEKGLDPAKFIGCAKFIGVKTRQKFQTKGNEKESWEQYAERVDIPVQFLFVGRDDKIAEEILAEHLNINKHVNTHTEEKDFPCNRSSCHGKYGLCEYFYHCNPKVDGDQGISLVSEDGSFPEFAEVMDHFAKRAKKQTKEQLDF